MEIIDVVNSVLRDFTIYVFTYLVFIKLINYKHNNYRKIIVIFIVSAIESIVGNAIAYKFGEMMAILTSYFLHSIIIGKLTSNNIYYSIVVTFISLVIAYISYIISIVISSVILKLVIPTIKSDNIVILLVAIIIEELILHMFFRLKRFKNGISFLKNSEKVNNMGIIGIAFIGIVILIYSKVGTHNSFWTNNYLCIGILIEAICLTIWIRRKITKHYKQNLKKNMIAELENEIKQKDAEINKITEENKVIATINHKYSSRIKALEKISSKILTKPELVEAMKVELGAEFGELQEQIKEISEEYSMEIKEKVKHEGKLAKTGIFGIDNLLEYMKEEAEKNNIKFNLKINANIIYMVDKVIDQSRLETLLGDHIKDAIIAINHSNNTYKSILTTIGIIDDCYEICIYDTGIEFEIDTLLKLGKEAITTHKETGGSGIGFMTTFETLKETKASLIIEEMHPMSNKDYTKAVRIRFDGKNEYKINSYRAEEIEKQKLDNRIIVEKVKK